MEHSNTESTLVVSSIRNKSIDGDDSSNNSSSSDIENYPPPVIIMKSHNGCSIKSIPSTTVTTAEEENDHEEDDHEDSPRFKKRSVMQLIIIMISLFLSLLLVSLDQSIVATALPVIASTFNSLEQVEWVGTAYIVPMTALQPIYGKLADIFGRKSTIIFSIIIFLIGSGFAGSAPNMVVLCVMRGIQGIGAAGISPLVMITIGDLVSLRERAKYQSLVGLCWATGSVAGPLIGGILSEKASWRWIFYINLPTGILALGILTLCLPSTYQDTEQEQDERELMRSWREKWLRIDFIGATLFIATVSCFLLATQWGGTQYPWTSPVILGLYGGCLLFALITIMLSRNYYNSKDDVVMEDDNNTREGRSRRRRCLREPILALHLFKMRDQVMVYIMAICFCMAMFMNVYYLPLYFQVAHGDTPLMAGVELLPFLAPVDLISILSGYLVTKTGYYRVMFWVGNALIAIGGGLESRLLADTKPVEQIIYLMLTGMGIGFCIQNVYVAAQANAAPSE
ncbi:major facilitator superfamily domain-containing protein [Phascolomyces articulosus]|uniref:Major facilitator superfamily domain-containing protein n=1 Tax=Phascolomyces articulosus TaxID=60185 RepID=A0AAD5K924_9FUNG|nr:major facilitator superfamily domain-containing protein [Phascolomyces articulosus]